MADINLVTANKVNIVESIKQLTAPAAEAITAGMAMRLDTASGKFTKAKATDAAEARVKWLAVKTVATGEAVTGIENGVMDGYDLSGLAYDAPVYLSDTDGRLADAAGTVSTVIGRVIPGTATTLGTALDKLLLVSL